jgi:hypothetical protein
LPEDGNSSKHVIEDDSILSYSDVSEVRIAAIIIALIIDAVRASETSVYFNETTRRYIPECCDLHTCRENLESHISTLLIVTDHHHFMD